MDVASSRVPREAESKESEREQAKTYRGGARVRAALDVRMQLSVGRRNAQ